MNQEKVVGFAYRMPQVQMIVADGALGFVQGHATDAGFDLPLFGLPNGELVLRPACWENDNIGAHWLPTGIQICLPDGIAARVVSRSSTFRNRGLEVYEGLIDPGYQGELRVCVVNRTARPVVVKDCERLAQVVFFPIITPRFDRVTEFPPTRRGTNGFGSTGR